MSSWEEMAADIRAEVEGRRRLAETIRTLRRARRPTLVRIRCPEPGCGRAVAHVTDTSQGPMFFALIYELPWDWREPPPWHGPEVEHFPVEMFDDEPETLVEAFVRSHRMQDPATNGPLRDDGGWTILDILDDSPWHPDLWVRCRNHPEAIEVDRDEIRRRAVEAKRTGKRLSYVLPSPD